MFGKRSDGKRLKHMPAFDKILPMLMKERNDAMTMTTIEFDTEPIKKFIKKQQEETGKVYRFFDILVAGIVRVIALRPALNRFIVNTRYYQRHNIQMGMTVQKSLKEGREENETNLKVTFDGTETIDEVMEKVNKEQFEAKRETEPNKTDIFLEKFMNGPHWIVKTAIGLLKWLDKHGMLSKGFVDLSPMHATFFITDLKSIKLPPVYHHIYNFGTTGMFFATSQEEEKIYYDKETGEFKVKNVMKVALVMDERICDGYYYSKSFRMLRRIMENPEVLFRGIPKEELPLDVDSKWKQEQEKKKEEAKQAKIDEKELKKRAKIDKEEAKSKKELNK